MVEIFKSKKGAEYQYDRYGKKKYRSLVVANLMRQYDKGIQKKETRENAHTIPVGIIREEDFLDWDQQKSQIEDSIDIQSVLDKGPFNEKEKQIIEGYEQGLNMAKIARSHGVSIEAIRLRRNQLALKIDKQLNPEEKDIDIHDEKFKSYDPKIRIRRFIDILPFDQEEKRFRYIDYRQIDVSLNGDNSVYDLLPPYVPENRSSFFIDAFNLFRQCLKDKKLNKETLLEMDTSNLEEIPGVNNKVIELLYLLKLAVYEEKEKEYGRLSNYRRIRRHK